MNIAAPLVGFSRHIAVRFSECDAYGVVWHGNYIAYLEELRNAVTARYGFTPARAMELGYLVPVIEMSLAYRAPARVDESVVVTGRLRPPIVPRFVMDYEIRRTDGSLLVTARSDQVVTRRSGELLLTMPRFLRELCDRILSDQDAGGPV
jgi:acyl-CoA thioester hydrolase